jgi:hypothetical protein
MQFNKAPFRGQKDLRREWEALSASQRASWGDDFQRYVFFKTNKEE